jgi:hypothetical protein
MGADGVPFMHADCFMVWYFVLRGWPGPKFSLSFGRSRLRLESYADMKLFVHRSTYVPFRRFLVDVRMDGVLATRLSC